jgi:2-dehydropantoate 2-reductase
MVQQEAMALLSEAQIKPAKLTAVPTHLIPKILSLPNPIFKLLSRKMLEIDPLARSSMQDDLLAGRLTEIDWINGEVLKLAEQSGQQAPINTRLIELVKLAEKSPQSFSISASDLKDQLNAAARE